MENLCKQYMKNVKTFFPILRKPEKEYLKNLERTIEDYLEEKSVTSLEELYKDFGTPTDVVHSYYSSVNIDYLLKRLNTAKIFKVTLITLMTITFVAVSAYCILLYSEHELVKSQQIFFEETFIE